MMNTLIFDIDGTLADARHRRHFVLGKKRDYDAFYKGMVDDPPLEDMCFLANLLADHPSTPNFLKLFVFTGRPEDYRAETEKWLSTYVPSLFQKCEAILMRKKNDFRKDYVVKKEMLDYVQKLGYEVRLVFDDRPTVIDMWKKEGLCITSFIWSINF
jgi:FMN phosphatase YigB (HAD superfamily)